MAGVTTILTLLLSAAASLSFPAANSQEFSTRLQKTDTAEEREAEPPPLLLPRHLERLKPHGSARGEGCHHQHLLYRVWPCDDDRRSRRAPTWAQRAWAELKGCTPPPIKATWVF